MSDARVFRVLVACLFLAACSGGQNIGVVPDEAGAVRGPAATHGQYLYAAHQSGGPTNNGFVDVFTTDGAKVRTVLDGVSGASALAADAAGNVYVANQSASTVTVYAPGGSPRLRTIRDGVHYPDTLIVDAAAGKLFVGNFQGAHPGPGSVTVYSTTTGQLLETLRKGVDNPQSFALDAAGDLFVGNNSGSVTKYPPGSTQPTFFNSEYSQRAAALAVDRSGNLYVAHIGIISWVTVYYSSVLGPTAITDGIQYPIALAFDRSGNLVVVNAFGGDGHRGTVNVYSSAGEHHLIRSTPAGDTPIAMALDRANNLYVASSSQIIVYAAGTGRILRTIHDEKALALLIAGS